MSDISIDPNELRGQPDPQYYADVDAEGNSKGFYHNWVHTDLPPGAVTITAEQWRSWVDKPNQRLVKGALIAYEVPKPAEQLIREQLALGIQVADFGTFPLTPAVVEQMRRLASDSLAGLGLPSGGDTMPINLLDGSSVELTEARIISLYKLQRNLVHAITEAATKTPSAWPRMEGSL